MNKAFVSEDIDPGLVTDFGYDPVEDEIAAGPGSGGANYITPSGLERLKQELEQLPSTGENERRARLLRKRIESAHVIVPENQSGERVVFGATVTVRDEDAKERVYRIVGIDETDLSQGKVSWISPIAKALLQAKVGDVVPLTTPQGDEELEIEKIEFKPLEEDLKN